MPHDAAGAGAAPDIASLPVRNRWLLTLGIMAATLLQILDTTIANVAIPHMQTALSATADSVTWILTSYIVASAIAIPLTGWLADTVGSRRLFLWSVAAFIASSMLCGLAQNLPEMVAFRILQGISAAFINPLSQSSMLDINKPSEQAKAMGIWGMGIMIGPIMGPIIGGWLTENYNWRWVFYVNVPVGIAALAILYFLLPTRPIRARRFDYTGFALLAVAVASLQLMLDRGQTEDWFHSPEIWIECILAVSCAWMFVIHMFTAKHPMFDRHILTNPNLLMGIAFMLVVGLLMMATMALLPPMLQHLFGYSVLDTGILLMPRGVGVLISMAIAGRLMARGFDVRVMVGLGMALAAVSLWEMSRWSLAIDAYHVIVSGVVQGLGMGLVFIPLTNVAFATLRPQDRTEGSSLTNLARNIGASVGISICTTMLARNTQISHADLAAHVTDFNLPINPSMTETLPGIGNAALAMIDAEVNRQAAMIAYIDDFWLMMWITALSIPLIIFIRKPKGPAVVDPAAAGH